MRGDPTTFPIWKDVPEELAKLVPKEVEVRRGISDLGPMVILLDPVRNVYVAGIESLFTAGRLTAMLKMLSARRRDDQDRLVQDTAVV